LNNGMSEVNEEIKRLTSKLLALQHADGTWRFCYDNGISTGAYMIITLRSLQMEDEPLIRRLHGAILKEQQPDGSWNLYRDEEKGNLSASVEAYYSLLYSGYSSRTDEPMRRAQRFILSQGGIMNVSNVITQAMLAATGQCRWPASLSIPLEVLLLPVSSPLNYFDFSAYARVHLVPILLLADRQYAVTTDDLPDLTELAGERLDQFERFSRGFETVVEEIKSGIAKLSGLPNHLHQASIKRAEQFMLQRIEPDGTLYSYASSTFLMIFALLALGYDKRHPVVTHAVQGVKALVCDSDRITVVQNSPPTVWDTALLSDALQAAGVPAHSAAIRNAGNYLLTKQHRKLGDWSLRVRDPVAGGWGFSDSNTLNPDVDDTTAALRAINQQARADPTYREAWSRGLNWVISLQNKDGGWPAFEKDTDNALLTWIAISGAKSAAIDPSTPDLTGRTLEYLGNYAGLGNSHVFIRRGSEWLFKHQEKDGSWYGRWGVWLYLRLLGGG